MNLAADIFIFEDGMQADPFDVLSYLLGILLANDLLVVFQNLLVLWYEALGISIELVRLDKQSLKHLNS